MVDSKYSSHAERLTSLSNWPGRNLFDIGAVAESGLYYLVCDDGDRVRCAFCEFTIANWKILDDIWKLHASFVPTCVHLLCSKGIEYVKEVLQEENCNAEHVHVLLNSTTQRFRDCRSRRPEDLTILGVNDLLLRRQQQSSSCSPSSRCAGQYRTSRGVPLTMPKHREMMHPNFRFASFDNADIRRTFPDLKVVVDAGFFYTGADGSLKCYHCGVWFKNLKWDDSLWEEHAKQAPHCIHVILTKGEEFVEKVLTDGRRKLKRSAREIGESGSPTTKKINVFGISEKEGVERVRRDDIDRSASTDAHDQPNMCRRCRRRSDSQAALGSVCCSVWVCESCATRDGHCPVCGRI
ncbi:E3 ubiquitin-protein ligase XIAP-like [Mercenaria mercenaria]|uniref:E3 ubiquitin-protein ligase XIAP-like n=1 Tax=Mercenaria mercenaria TaxID=6596 RepID=UPI001E1E04B9|nr:E3 ubiquitin-protein ligase XIAP-like [Mercenaria mercenaria]XP_045195502.1 E3 ubiquitin-protein ligase XIAP-like [Mercenaria mercenaria]